MCILFLYTADKPDPGNFKLILAANRDEMYKRPTKEAHFWEANPSILGGMDKEPGREGGTWLAVSKSGKIGSLLNVLISRKDAAEAKQKKGRGCLVNNYVMNSTSANAYCYSLRQNSQEYSPFSILAIDVQTMTTKACYYCSASSKEPVDLISGTVHGFGNSYMDVPFQKVRSGRERMDEVVKNYKHTSKRSELVQGILEVLKSEEKFPTDPQIHKQAPDYPEEVLQGMSSRFIKLPSYGTRTHTIILVDYENRVYFQELTLAEPIGDTNQTWTKSTYEFKIGE